MTKKKGGNRIRQNRTEWQKVFDKHPGMIQPFSWPDRIPEVLHISMALIDHDFETVKQDFYKISNYVNNNYTSVRKFHFNLSHAIRLIKDDHRILHEIDKTSFKEAFKNILSYYHPILNIRTDVSINASLLLNGYKQILKGRSDISILCKYLMIQYDQNDRPDTFNLFNLNSVAEILIPTNVSSIMAMFPPSIGQSENLDLHFCNKFWTYNNLYSPFMIKPDDTKNEEAHYNEMKLDELKEEFISLYTEFKDLNLLAVYNRFTAEVNMGLLARVCNLTIDVVELVKTHKGEIAEIVFRPTLETFIIGSWLIKKKDIELYKRFREYSLGREKFFGEELLKKAVDENSKNDAKRIIKNTDDNSGLKGLDLASERGDIFNLRLDQIADEVWGPGNGQYFIYKRASEVIHGHWRVIAKYHLSESLNPMHMGLYSYNDNKNRFAGLVPAFASLLISTEFLITITNDIKFDDVENLKDKLGAFHKKLSEHYLQYFEKYISTPLV